MMGIIDEIAIKEPADKGRAVVKRHCSTNDDSRYFACTHRVEWSRVLGEDFLDGPFDG
jgi:hypothetical protein